MRFSPGNAQHIGARPSQQDAFGYSDPENSTLVSHGGLVAVVADGMGGMANGRDAALYAIRTFLDAYALKSPSESIPDALMRALHSANAAVVYRARELQVEGEMGTTLVAVALHEASYYSVSVGDSAAYLMRNGRLYQLTASHTHGEDLDREVAKRHLSETQALNDPERHALTSFLGLERLVEIDASGEPRSLQAGDRILVCSDGLSKVLEERQIIAGLGREPQQAAELLLQQVLQRQVPEQDNVTILVVACEGEEDQPKEQVPAPAPQASSPAASLPPTVTPTIAEAPPPVETAVEDNRPSAFEEQVLGDEPAPSERTRPWSPSPKVVIPALVLLVLLFILLLSQSACPHQATSGSGTSGSGATAPDPSAAAPDPAPPTPESAASDNRGEALPEADPEPSTAIDRSETSEDAPKKKSNE